MGKIDKKRGDRIRELRLQKGDTQDELAEKVGATDGSHVSKWESGKGITRKYIVKLAKYFDTSAEFIEHGSEHPRPNIDDFTVEEMIGKYKDRKEKRDFSDTEKALLLEVLLENAESLSKGLRRLIELEKNHSDD